MLGQKIIFGIISAQSVVILLLLLGTTDILNQKYFKMLYSLPSFSSLTNLIQNNNQNSKMAESTINLFQNYNITRQGSLWPIKFLPQNYTQTDKEHYENQALGNNRIFQLISYGIEASRNNYSMFNVTRKKLIYLRIKRPGLDIYEDFLRQSHFCFKYSACELTNDAKRIPNASAVVNLNFNPKPMNSLRRSLRADQIYVASIMESPDWFRRASHGYPKPLFDSRVWITNYRSDADIAIRYYAWAYFDPKVRQKKQNISYSKGKTEQAMALISHCPTRNRRMELVRVLSKFMKVDIYGEVSRKIPNNITVVIQKLSTYKFFLAFENSNCREYITEKVFRNSFQANAIPIVFGAHPKDYANQLPDNSYILLQNYKSAKELGTYLKYLDKNDTAYNEYFRWRGTGQFLSYYDTFPCTLCAMLFYDEQVERRPAMKRSFEHWNEHMADGSKACKPKRVGPNLCRATEKSLKNTTKFPPLNDKHIWW